MYNAIALNDSHVVNVPFIETLRARMVVVPKAPKADKLKRFGSLYGSSPAMQKIYGLIERVAQTDATVLIVGESGSGKELVANSIHRLSARSKGPFVALNCGAIPEGLCESELFGHVRGAFTGAVRAHSGAFSRASGGTLFLDEVAELPLPLQAKLLRVLETRRIIPLGGEAEQPVEVRIVAATHQPLEALVLGQRFRGDLFHRLGALQLELPALRERSEDIPALLAHFAAVLGREFGRPVVLTPAAVSAASAHAWQGKKNKLHNALLRAAAAVDGPLTATDLLPAARTPAPPAIAVPRGTWAEMNRALLDRVVAEAGSIRKAAVALAVPRSTLAAWLHVAP